MYIYTSDNVDELSSVGVRRQVKAIRFDGEAGEGYSDALELLIVRVPWLKQACFTLYAVVGFASFKSVELAQILALVLGCTAASEAAMEEEEEANGEREQQRFSHFE